MSSSQAILFVDDEPRVLNGLRRMLHPLRDRWSMAFAMGADEALEVLGAAHFEAIVADVRMPGMNGVELLGEARRRQPGIVRIALSGQASKKTVLGSVGLVHQYLAKPCEAQTMRSTVRRLGTLRQLVPDADFRRRLCERDSLPSLPSAYHRLAELLARPRPAVNQVARTIAADVGMSARILQLVSSAFFARPTHMAGPAKAAVFLGLEILRGLTFSAPAFSWLDEQALAALPVQELTDHSRIVAKAAKALARAETKDRGLIDQAYIAGLLHDAGKVVFATEAARRYASALPDGREADRPLLAAERDAFAADHAQVGAYLLALWGLPESVVQAVAFHHAPREAHVRRFAPLTAVHAANALVQAYGPSGPMNSGQGVDEAYLVEAGLKGRLPVWRDICKRVVRRETAALQHSPLPGG